jgi:hypothetical protein
VLLEEKVGMKMERLKRKYGMKEVRIIIMRKVGEKRKS